jgi:aspartyl-tRNA(Asn)/glutamyl-tRNA(Gln) amidotransferase subunit C
MLSFWLNIVYIVPRVNFMSLNKSDVEKIAHLARLQIEEADIPLYANNLSNILQLVEQMSAVDTTGVEIMAHPLDAGQRLRADDVTEIDQRALFQSIAPQVEAGLYLVPKVLE